MAALSIYILKDYCVTILNILSVTIEFTVKAVTKTTWDILLAEKAEHFLAG